MDSQYHITIRIYRNDDGEGFQATVDELPDVAEFGDSVSDVLALIADTIETTNAVMKPHGHQWEDFMMGGGWR